MATGPIASTICERFVISLLGLTLELTKLTTIDDHVLGRLHFGAAAATAEWFICFYNRWGHDPETMPEHSAHIRLSL
jgi:hypothetical protein